MSLKYNFQKKVVKMPENVEMDDKRIYFFLQLWNLSLHPYTNSLAVPMILTAHWLEVFVGMFRLDDLISTYRRKLRFSFDSILYWFFLNRPMIVTDWSIIWCNGTIISSRNVRKSLFHTKYKEFLLQHSILMHVTCTQWHTKHWIMKYIDILSFLINADNYVWNLD